MSFSRSGFFSIVIFMIKWMLASIPALIIVGIIFAGLGFGISILVEMFDLGYLFDGVIVLPPH